MQACLLTDAAAQVAVVLIEIIHAISKFDMTFALLAIQLFVFLLFIFILFDRSSSV